MKKTIIISILVILLLIAPLGVITATALTTPCQYDETFLGELTEKHTRLQSINEEKIVLIGGSSLAFGLDSKKLEEYLGKPVINYGLYATIGTKAMLDMSRKHINAGDIVVICPETDPQTYSLYYNAHSMWQALDCDLSMLKDVGFSNLGKLIAAIPEFANEKRGFIRNNQKPAPTGIYAKASFNEYGDIKVDRPFNEMPKNYDTSMPVALTTDLLDTEFIDYLNKYAAQCERKGAKVYFSFSPINADSVISTDEEKAEFYNELNERLDFPVISNIDDYVLDSGFFYDTNFHLNSTGALQRTSLLADDLVSIVKVKVCTEKYEPPKRPDDYFASSGEGDQNAKYFDYEEIEGGVAIIGLTKEGKNEKVLTIPTDYNGKPVLTLNDNAFKASKVLEHIIIPESSNIKGIDLAAFSGCEKLRIVELHLAPYDLPIDPQVFVNASPDCYVYVPDEKYSEFATDYFWSSMMQFVRTISELP